MQTLTLFDRLDVMIAVLPAVSHVQKQIDFRRCKNYNFLHMYPDYLIELMIPMIKFFFTEIAANGQSS